MKRFASIFALVGMAAMVFALRSYEKVFDETYSIKKTSALGKADCAVCHVTPKAGKLNKYGLDLKEALKAAGAKKMTPEILKSVEELDSNKNGVKNIDDIKADHNPGL